jgi:XTP/dITP diphosphohydrolase
MTLIFATNNLHKLHEVREKLRMHHSNIEILSLADIGFSGDLPETGDTLQANALQKVQTLYERIGKTGHCFADDTGLEIEALNGEPGVYSARYAEMRGRGNSFDDNMNLVLSQMQGKSNRRACFKTVIALILNGEIYYFEGRIDGEITTEKHGTEGFGYDPIFRPDGYKETFAELPLEVKNKISHRGRATEGMVKFLTETNNK